MKLSGKTSELYGAFRDGLLTALGANLYALYIYGAAAFPESRFTGDIDFHVILADLLTADEKQAIEAVHRRMADDHPPLGAELDGYYILLEDARRKQPPRHQLAPHIVDSSWALHRAHIRAGRCITLHGPDPRGIYLEPTWDELERALWGELKYVEEHLTQCPDYCTLNLCRLVYSFETRDVVVSKGAAARWALDALSEWRELVEAANRSYSGEATPADSLLLESRVPEMFESARQRIRAAMQQS